MFLPVWGYTFKVYHIENWSADGGSSLRHQRSECGILTGWLQGIDPSGRQADFNLPFSIRRGCVERAIVSARGPRILCLYQGLGKPSEMEKTGKKHQEVEKYVSH